MDTYLNPALDLVSTLLMDVARRIQLSPGDYRLAAERYGTVWKFLIRDASPLRGFVTRLYPQGSMAIGATIASKLRNDEFDIDVVVELALSRNPLPPPSTVLDALFGALNGAPGSLYHGKVVRNTRCVTLEYANMHLDLTPAILLGEQQPRTSVIFHAHEKQPPEQHRHILANPWGFADWFEKSIPASALFAEAVLRKSMDPVPDQAELNEKSLPLISLQLLKRWRNKCYDRRQGRCPPSVLLTYFVGINPGIRTSLLQDLLSHVRFMRTYFDEHNRRGALINIFNPACPNHDKLSDRWPSSLADQEVFADDLNDLERSLTALLSKPSVSDCSTTLSRLFGETPTEYAVDALQKRFSGAADHGLLFHRPLTAGIAMGSSGLLLGSNSVQADRLVFPTPRATNFGSEPSGDN